MSSLLLSVVVQPRPATWYSFGASRDLRAQPLTGPEIVSLRRRLLAVNVELAQSLCAAEFRLVLRECAGVFFIAVQRGSQRVALLMLGPVCLIMMPEAADAAPAFGVRVLDPLDTLASSLGLRITNMPVWLPLACQWDQAHLSDWCQPEF